MKVEETPGMALVFAAGVCMPALLKAADEMHEEEVQDHGYMEFFDWLAGTKNEELNSMYQDLCGLECADLTNPHARHRVGLEVWNQM